MVDKIIETAISSMRQFQVSMFVGVRSFELSCFVGVFFRGKHNTTWRSSRQSLRCSPFFFCGARFLPLLFLYRFEWTSLLSCLSLCRKIGLCCLGRLEDYVGGRGPWVFFLVVPLVCMQEVSDKPPWFMS